MVVAGTIRRTSINTLEILTASRAKIADKNNWCQVASARNFMGASVSPYSITACSWCSVGAIECVEKSVFDTSAHVQLEAFMGNDIGEFNDTHSHSEVLAAWDKAIAECAKEYNGN
jgi:hypothetical protein